MGTCQGAILQESLSDMSVSHKQSWDVIFSIGVELKGIMLSERSQTQTVKYYVISLIHGI